MDVFAPLQWLADWLTYSVFTLESGSNFASSVNFFIFDTLKIFILLAVIIFIVSLMRTYAPPEKTKKFLSHQKYPLLNNFLAALVGVATPFCSCSAVPMFIGFVEAGVPLGVTLSFLISSPMVNEVALALLWGLFGWQIAIIYMISGVLIATIAGYVIGRLHLEKLVEDFVFKIKGGAIIAPKMSFKDRYEHALVYAKDILGKVWLYVIIGVAVGAAIHGYAPNDFLLSITGQHNILAVPLVVVMGIPLYSNAAGIIPIVSVLIDKGMAIGTALAFMMAVTALSLPEFIILRKVLKPKLLAIYAAIVGVGIIFTGYLFNIII